jgi:hypothetical protein
MVYTQILFKLKEASGRGIHWTPLLFAISTQPLISYMDHRIHNQQLPAIQINSSLTVCKMLFADHVGIFIPASETAFIELCNCTSLYEQASGAKLNLQKSVITPISLDIIPDWINKTGCSITKEGKIHKYLGAPFGINLTSSAVQSFCLNKLAKRITTLKPRFILFTGRFQLIKQVLSAMQIYHMMYTLFKKSTTVKIERLCQEFLWGHNKNGSRKVP